MVKSEEEIKSEIKNHIDKNGGPYSSQYVGISENPENRLFTVHNVDRNYDIWIYRETSSSNVARRIEDYFINVIGTDGGPGGGDEDAKYVYAYKKNSHTNP